MTKGCILVCLVPSRSGPKANLVTVDKSATGNTAYWHDSLYAGDEATWMRLTKGMELPSGRLRFGTLISSFAMLVEEKLAPDEVFLKGLSV